MMDRLWGEVRSACALGLWSEAIQAVDVAASVRCDPDTLEDIDPAITPEQAAELLRYCARAAAGLPDLDAVADFAVAVVCEAGQSWPCPVHESYFWDDEDASAGEYRLRVYPAGDLWGWSVTVGGSTVGVGSEGSERLARASALRAARRSVLAAVRALF